MLPIGEDLGVIPKEVRLSLKRLGICGTKVMRWERDWEGDKKFYLPDTYSPLSMTTVSTHDSSPLALWWVQTPEESKEYALERGWEYTAPLPSDEQFAILYDSHHSTSLFHINLLGEYLALFPQLVWPSLKMKGSMYPESSQTETGPIASDHLLKRLFPIYPSPI